MLYGKQLRQSNVTNWIPMQDLKLYHTHDKNLWLAKRSYFFDQFFRQVIVYMYIDLSIKS